MEDYTLHGLDNQKRHLHPDLSYTLPYYIRDDWKGLFTWRTSVLIWFDSWSKNLLYRDLVDRRFRMLLVLMESGGLYTLLCWLSLSDPDAQVVLEAWCDDGKLPEIQNTGPVEYLQANARYKNYLKQKMSLQYTQHRETKSTDWMIRKIIIKKLAFYMAKLSSDVLAFDFVLKCNVS